MTKPLSIHIGEGPRLAVRLKATIKASNGQDFISGQVAGFEPASSVALVKHGAAVVHLTPENESAWRAALQASKLGAADAVRIVRETDLTAHPEMAKDRAAVFELEAQEEAQRREEEKAIRRGEDRAPTPAEIAQAMKDGTATFVSPPPPVDPVQTSASPSVVEAPAPVSTPVSNGEEVHPDDAPGDVTPPPAPDAPKPPASPRGNKSPRR